MNSPLIPNSADALLFDLGRVVLDIDLNKVVASWAGHSGCEPSHLVGRFSPDEAWRRHERGEISDAAFFESLRASLGIDITNMQFLEGWNSIFAGEMPGIAAMLARAGTRACRTFFARLCRCARSFPRDLPVIDDRASETRSGSL